LFFFDLNALLYLGILSIAGGLAWTVQTSFADLGDTAILLTLSSVLGGCFYYAFTRGQPYSSGRVASASLAFGYVLYLGCLVFAIELAYVEVRFRILKDTWDYLVLLSALAFFGLAYRFDNRFVLSLALSTLATWFGIKLSFMGFDSPAALRPTGLAYAALVGAVGLGLHHLEIKKHFLETYLHISVNIALIALMTGTVEEPVSSWYLIAVLALSAVVIWQGIRYRAFAFVAYGVLYAYAAITSQLMRYVNGPTFGSLYFLGSGIAVVVLLIF